MEYNIDTSKLDAMPLTELEVMLMVIDRAISNKSEFDTIRKLSSYRAELKSYMRKRVEETLSINLLY